MPPQLTKPEAVRPAIHGGQQLFEERQPLSLFKIAWLLCGFVACFIAVPFAFTRRFDIITILNSTMLIVFTGAALFVLRSLTLVTRVDRDARHGALELSSIIQTHYPVELQPLASLRAGTWEALGERCTHYLGRLQHRNKTVFSAGSERAVRLEFKNGPTVLVGSERPEQLRSAIELAASGRA
jgi:hypothetical protein